MAKKLDYMSEERSIWKYIFLGVLTCGIYDLWYVHNISKDVNKLYKDKQERLPGVGAYFLLCLVTCGIYSLFWWLKAAKMIENEGRRRKLDIGDLNPPFIILCFVLSYFCGFAQYIAIHQIFETMNKLAADYNREVRTFPPSYFENTAN